MPEYRYHCEKCDKDVTVWLRISEVPLKNCPECKGENCMKRIFDAVPFIDHTNSFYSRNNIK